MTEKELQEKINKLQDMYKKRENNLFVDVMLGKITSYDQLLSGLRSLDEDFQADMEDYAPLYEYYDGFDPITIKTIEEAEVRGENIISAVKDILYIGSILSEKRVFKNSKGQICDEYGTPLNKDGEHRVFDVIIGGKPGK